MTEFWESFSLGKRFYRQCFDPIAKKHDLSTIELDIIMFLHQNAGFDTATDITEKRGIAKPNVSTALRKLIERRLIEGIQGEKDRRRIHLRLLPACHEILSDAEHARIHFLQVLFRDFSEEERHQISVCLSRMVNNVRHAESST